MFCNQNEFAVEKEVTILLRSELVAALISSHFLIFQKKLYLALIGCITQLSAKW